MKEDNKHIVEETEVDEYNNYKFEHYSDEEEQQQCGSNNNNEQGNKEDDEEDEYGNDFETDETEMKKMELKEESEKNNLNLDDYKEIHETQKIYTHMNFFEDSYIDPNANAGNGNAKGNNKVGQLNRPKSPKFKKEHMSNNNNNYDNDVNNKSNLDSVFGRDVSQNYSINPIQDSYGDNIIKDLNRFRKMALEESEDFCNNDGSVIGSKYIK